MSDAPSLAAPDSEPSSVRPPSFGHDPFADGAVDEAYFESERAAELLSRAVHLLDYTQLLLFIQGVTGVGKSTFLQRLMLQGGPDWRVATINVGSALSVGACLTAVAQGLGADSSVVGDDIALEQFVDFVTNTSVRGVTLVLMVDDAEKLNPAEAEAIALLAEPLDGARPLLRVVLSGESLPESLVRLLPKNEEGGSLLQVMPMPVLDEDDVRRYLQWRLTQMGWKGAFPFAPAKVAEMAAVSKGVFAALNKVASAALSGEARGTLKGVGNAGAKAKKSVHHTSRVLVLSLAVVAAIGLWMNMYQPVREPVSLSVINPVRQIVPPRPAEPAVPNGLPEVAGANHAGEQAAVAPIPIPIPAPHELALAPIKAPPPVVATAPAAAPAPAVLPAPVEVVLAPVEVAPASVAPSSPPTAAAPAVPAPAPRATVPSGAGADWMRARDPSHFTLQYGAVVTLEGAQKFAAQHGLTDAVIYRVIRGGREWSVVVAGDYADMKSAQLAALDGPASLSKSKPWARRFGVLQGELAAQAELAPPSP